MWSRELSERLCELYQAEDLLYNCDHEEYHNRDHRLAAWEHIAKSLGVSVNEAREKLDNLRTMYSRSRKDSGKRGNPGHWTLHKMSFLEPFTKKTRKVAGSIDKSVSCAADDILIKNEGGDIEWQYKPMSSTAYKSATMEIIPVPLDSPLPSPVEDILNNSSCASNSAPIKLPSSAAGNASESSCTSGIFTAHVKQKNVSDHTSKLRNSNSAYLRQKIRLDMLEEEHQYKIELLQQELKLKKLERKTKRVELKIKQANLKLLEKELLKKCS
jgi:hypothetical protein